MKRFIPILLLLTFLGVVAPGVAHAQQTEREGETTYKEAYVPCGTKDETRRVKQADGTYTTESAQQEITLSDGTKKMIPGDGVVDNPCQFTHIIEFARKLIMGWIIFGIIMATMGFAYAGLLYITAMGAQEKISHAHSIFVKTFWGFFFMLSAWLIAYTMERAFLTEEALKNSFLAEPASQ